MNRVTRLIAIGALVAPAMFAQFGSGIQGTVVDASSAVMPKVQITVKNLDTGVLRHAETSDEGVYFVLNLGPGKYSVTAVKEGFSTGQQSSLSLAANEVRKVDFTLTVQTSTQEVTVAATTPALETEQGRVSSQITARQLEDLPVPNRNVINLMVLQPGVTGTNLSNEMFGSDSTPAFNANGMRSDGNSYSLDDSNINSISRGGRAEVTPNVETVAEVRVTTNNFSAEQGRNMGAHVSIVTKSGTNRLHGSLWEYHTDNVLQDRNIFTPTPRVPVNRRNQFGTGVGGPIFKNRTFFYGTYEGSRRSGTVLSTATVWTPQLRDYVEQSRPNSIAANIMKNFPPVADPTINVRDIGSPAVGVNKWNTTPDGIPDIGTVQYLTAQYAHSDQYTIRIDHELRPGKDRLYGYFYRLTADTITPGIFPAFLRPNPTAGTFGNLVYSSTITPSTINEVRAAVTRFIGFYCAVQDPKNPLGPLSCNDIAQKQVPGISITGIGTVRDVNVFPGGFFPTEYQLKDTLSLVRGRHELKLGAEVRRAKNILWHTASYIPVYTFANILDFVDDEPLQMTRTVNPQTGLPDTTRADELIWEGDAFLQDDFKVKPNFTLNLGVRWDYFGPYTDTHNRFRNLVLGSGNYVQQLADGVVNVTPRAWDPSKLNFAPRLGFAWDVGGQGKNVVRGGYGLSYDRMATVQTATYRTNPPLSAQANLGLQFGTTFTYSLGDPTKPYLGYPVDPSLKLGLDPHNGINGLRVAIAAVDPGFRQPYGHNWFLGVERQLPGRTALEVSWIGSAGHHLVNIANVNRYDGDLLDNVFNGFNYSFSAINMARTTSNSIYNAGSVAVRHQMAAGLSFQASYTFGKALTDAEIEQGVTNYYDVNNRNLDRSVASFDARQRVAFSASWNLPSPRCGIACTPLRGWQLAGYGIFQSGSPLNVITTAAYPNGDYNADGTNADRPNAPSDAIARSGFSKHQFLTGIFKASDFPKPAPGTDGTLGRNAFTGPGFARVDMSLERNFRITENIRTILRLEAYNSLNRTNLNSPSTDLTSNTFGTVTSAQPGRSLTVSARLRF